MLDCQLMLSEFHGACLFAGLLTLPSSDNELVTQKRRLWIAPLTDGVIIVRLAKASTEYDVYSNEQDCFIRPDVMNQLSFNDDVACSWLPQLWFSKIWQAPHETEGGWWTDALCYRTLNFRDEKQVERLVVLTQTPATSAEPFNDADLHHTFYQQVSCFERSTFFEFILTDSQTDYDKLRHSLLFHNYKVDEWPDLLSIPLWSAGHRDRTYCLLHNSPKSLIQRSEKKLSESPLDCKTNKARWFQSCELYRESFRHLLAADEYDVMCSTLLNQVQPLFG